MVTEKDLEQDELIRQNAEHIRRNDDAIRRQTECLEKIRDHYFPKKTFWTSFVGIVIKVVGAVTICTGLMEGVGWYVDARAMEKMAEQSVTVAKRLMFEENDMTGAQNFLERAIELDGNNAKCRAMLGYVKGMATIADLFNLGRPLAADERARVDAILAEAVFLQSAMSKDPMPYVLTAQANVLRGDFVHANEAIAEAVALAPKNILVRCSGCAIRAFAGDFDMARKELAEAERLQPDFPLVLHWRGMLAIMTDRDFPAARRHFAEMVRLAPRLALPHEMLGSALMNGRDSDLAAARVEFDRALALTPTLRRSLVMMGETYEREGRLRVAKIWYDRALACDGRFMQALLARARVNGSLGNWTEKVDDLSKAIALDPFRADFRRERAVVLDVLGKRNEAAADRAVADELEK